MPALRLPQQNSEADGLSAGCLDLLKTRRTSLTKERANHILKEAAPGLLLKPASQFCVGVR